MLFTSLVLSCFLLAALADTKHYQKDHLTKHIEDVASYLVSSSTTSEQKNLRSKHPSFADISSQESHQLATEGVAILESKCL